VAVVQYAGTTMGERFLKREIEGPVRRSWRKPSRGWSG
jgi:hypothetical protein